jgi:CHAT domain-containing protein
LRLVFLAACESAKRGPDDGGPFVGLAAKLVQVGIPAVVAMQDQIRVEFAQELTRSFYPPLLSHGVVDRAMSQARLVLHSSGSTEWAIPVLYMRLEDGRLFSSELGRS